MTAVSNILEQIQRGLARVTVSNQGFEKSRLACAIRRLSLELGGIKAFNGGFPACLGWVMGCVMDQTL